MIFNQIMDNQDLMGQIYSFDRTFRDEYNRVIQEFKYIMRYFQTETPTGTQWNNALIAEFWFDYESFEIAEISFYTQFEPFRPYDEGVIVNYKYNYHLFLKVVKNPYPYISYHLKNQLTDRYKYCGNREQQFMEMFYYPNLKYGTDEFENFKNSFSNMF